MTNPPPVKTAFTDMLLIDYPLIGAPMFLVSYEELAAAVSAAGGLGALPLPNFRTLADLEAALGKVRELTDKPIGVNIHLSGKFEWKKQLKICLETGVRFFITSLGDPSPILEEVHASGGKVFADVVTVEQGLRARDRGLDGLIAVGAGAGGHGGRTPTMVLVPYLKQKTGLPVIAAGGISTGAQMAAALCLGACAVITGTRLVATLESRAQEAYKQAVIQAGPEDIVCTDKITGNPANWLARSIQSFEEQPELGSKKWRDLWSAGQSVAQAEAIEPAGQIILEMVTDFYKTCREMSLYAAQWPQSF
ncbi:MAG: nitronate monooxygenase [Desulfobacterales bacterium]|nr:nitronate monooxygenase [Desulfobacterales bacterium]